MTVVRARIVKGEGASARGRSGTGTGTGTGTYERGRRVAGVVIDARAEAERIEGEARGKAEGMILEAREAVAGIVEGAVREAREKEIARVTAELIGMRVSEEQKAERQLDRTVEIAVLLAERLIGDAIVLDPARVTALARGAVEETRGARQLRIEACREDIGALHAMLTSLGEGLATIEPSTELTRGSLVVHTELGRVDARLAPQLARLAASLREALRGVLEAPGAPSAPDEAPPTRRA